MKIKKYNFTNILALILISLITLAIACSSKKKTVVAEIGDEKITLAEFEKQYLRTIINEDSARNKSLQDKKDFLDLLVKFRLKVKDARDRGLLESPEIQNDLKEYKKNFISTFLIDKEVVMPYVKELYERKKYEVRASHILIMLSQTPTPEDSIRAYLKADTIRKRLKNGEDFSLVAMEMSEDQTAKQNGGDLYYFTGGMTVPEFEDIVYSIKAGGYTKEPVRTMFGLHFVKLTDKKKRYDGIRASHILIQDQKDSTGMVIDSLGTLDKAKSILERLKNGEDFSAVASEVSQDPGSKDKGGDLGFFDRRRMVQSFDSAAFSLKVGQISDLVRTPFGWHIIKLTEVKEYEPFEKQLDNLKNEFKRSQTYRVKYNQFLENMRKDYDFKISDEGYNFLRSKFDSTRTFSSYMMDSLFSDADKQVLIATYKNGELKVSDLIFYFNTNRDYSSNTAIESTLRKVIESASDLPLMNKLAEKKDIEKDEEYVSLLTEYENGLLSFKIDQEELWSKIKITTEDMQQYYEVNKDKYTYVQDNETKYKDFEDVKSEISSTLQQDKFKELEKNYIDSLKQKYVVKIYENELDRAFKD